jgi:hypothetical protein
VIPVALPVAAKTARDWLGIGKGGMVRGMLVGPGNRRLMMPDAESGEMRLVAGVRRRVTFGRLERGNREGDDERQQRLDIEGGEAEKRDPPPQSADPCCFHVPPRVPIRAKMLASVARILPRMNDVQQSIVRK